MVNKMFEKISDHSFHLPREEFAERMETKADEIEEVGDSKTTTRELPKFNSSNYDFIF